MSGHRCDTGHFDRTICPEPCGMMHSFCSTCGARADVCAHETSAPEPREDVAVAEVLAAHGYAGWGKCACGWKRYGLDSQEHRAHVAEALAPLIAERERAAAVEALREAADGIERELICCDVYERRDHAAKHHICYWGGAARALVLARADRRAER